MIKTSSLINNLQLIREKSPLIHNITNYVVMNNTANALLAIGASPVMAHSIDELHDIVKHASALVINIGTLDSKWLKSMLEAGKLARSIDVPIVLDPVGAGASEFRRNACQKIIKHCKPKIIRGNASEIMALVDNKYISKGVDSLNPSEAAIELAKILAQTESTVVTISGQIDYITDGYQVLCVKNGNKLMEKVTGLGCTATAIIAAFAAIEHNMLLAATHGMAIMGIAGELAAIKAAGPGSLQMHFIDELYNMDNETIKWAVKN